jgi:hypothetical protein
MTCENGGGQHVASSTGEDLENFARLWGNLCGLFCSRGRLLVPGFLASRPSSAIHRIPFSLVKGPTAVGSSEGLHIWPQQRACVQSSEFFWIGSRPACVRVKLRLVASAVLSNKARRRQLFYRTTRRRACYCDVSAQLALPDICATGAGALFVLLRSGTRGCRGPDGRRRGWLPVSVGPGNPRLGLIVSSTTV